MKTIVLSALALGAMTTAAAAEPQAMSDDQLAGVAAGVVTVGQSIAQFQLANGLALDLSPFGGTATVDIDQTQAATNNAVVTVTETVTNVLPPAPPVPEVPKLPPICCFLPVK